MRILTQYHARLEGADMRALGNLTRRVVAQALQVGQAPESSEVSVLFVDDNEMRALNARYRDIDRTTDVLAFAMRESDSTLGSLPGEGALEVDRLLGDVVVSLEKAQRQALARGHSTRREIAVLLAHGTLHLLGYDHHTEPGQAGAAATRRMRQAEAACLAILQQQLIV